MVLYYETYGYSYDNNYKKIKQLQEHESLGVLIQSATVPTQRKKICIVE